MVTRLTDPFEALLALQRNLERRRDADWLERGTSAAGPYPAINFFQKGDDLVAIAEIPGIQRSELIVQVKSRTLRIAGTRPAVYGEHVSVHRRERGTGSFDRTVNLPVEVDADAVHAEYRDGILAVLLPRAERDRPRTIEVQ